jgi:hypothetical protein
MKLKIISLDINEKTSICCLEGIYIKCKDAKSLKVKNISCKY